MKQQSKILLIILAILMVIIIITIDYFENRLEVKFSYPKNYIGIGPDNNKIPDPLENK
jgi:hypothetical protein